MSRLKTLELKELEEERKEMLANEAHDMAFKYLNVYGNRMLARFVYQIYKYIPVEAISTELKERFPEAIVDVGKFYSIMNSEIDDEDKVLEIAKLNKYFLIELVLYAEAGGSDIDNILSMAMNKYQKKQKAEQESLEAKVAGEIAEEKMAIVRALKRQLLKKQVDIQTRRKSGMYTPYRKRKRVE